MATTVIRNIFINPQAEVACPTLPNKGEFFNLTTLKNAGWVALGSIQEGADGDLDSEAVTQTPFNEGVAINPPGSQTLQGWINRKSGIQSVEFTAYDVDEAVYALSSTVAETGVGTGVYDHTKQQTYRSMLIETETGLFVDWYPRVMLAITDETAGYGPGDDAVAKLKFTATVLDSDAAACNGGRFRAYLQAAS